MAKLQKHLGWVVAGVIAAAAVGLLVVKVMPNLNRIRTAQATIDGTLTTLNGNMMMPVPGSQPVETGQPIQAPPAQPVPTPDPNLQPTQAMAPTTGPAVPMQAVADLQAVRSQLIQQYAAGWEYYLQFETAFETWFEGLASPPLPDAFMNEYLAQGQGNPDSLVNQMTAAGVQIGYPAMPDAVLTRGFNWEDLSADTLQVLQQNPEYVNILQKRYWIRDRVVRAILEGRGAAGDLEVSRLLEFRFARVLPGLDPTPTSGGGQAPGRNQIPYVDFLPAFLAQLTGQMSQRGFEEPFVTADKLARTVTFGVTIEIPAEHVPTFLRRILDVNRERRMLIQVISWRMGSWQENVEVTQVFSEPGQEDAVRAQQEALVRPTPVIFMFQAQALDMDPTSRETFPQ